MIVLNELLKFKNLNISERYQKDFPNNKLSAEQALQELLKYFWLCQKHRLDKSENIDNPELNFNCGLHPEMHEIDDMWHTFLLFTREYAEFCQNYFGYFLHHVPKTKEEDIQADEAQLTRYLSYIYDNLGEVTLRTWFAEK